ncbi:MAG: hypothetical protein WCF84_17330 [Anaerolineae bacterium]
MSRLDVNTKFQIDLDLWKAQGRDFREQLYDELCEDCKRLYSLDNPRQVDRVSPTTGEIVRVDGIWECLMDDCGRQPDYIAPRMPMTRAILRTILASGNIPMTAAELHKRIGRGNPQVILKELLGPEMANDGLVPLDK